MPILDLTKPLNEQTEIYQDDSCSDPPFVVTDWCSIAGNGYWVSKLEMGTQSGTHIDAPAHFFF